MPESLHQKKLSKYNPKKPSISPGCFTLPASQIAVGQQSRLPTINPEINSELSQVYKSIVQLNRNYLSEKVKVAQARRPQRYNHRLPTKTGVSEYNRKYDPHKRSLTLADSTPQMDTSGSRMRLPNSQITNLQSSYQMDYSEEKHRQILPLVTLTSSAFKQKLQNQSDERPFFKESAYKRDYEFRGLVATEAAKQYESIALGARFLGESTYKNNYRKGHLTTMPSEPVMPREHKLFVRVLDQNTSTYQDNYMNKRGSAEESFKPPYKGLQHFKSIGLKSQYKKAYEEKQKAKQNDFDYLDQEQLNSYIMSLPKK